MNKLISSLLLDGQSRQPSYSVVSQYSRMDYFARYLPEELAKCS